MSGAPTDDAGRIPWPPNPNIAIREPWQPKDSPSPVLTTDRELHAGREPEHIDRLNEMRVFGYNAPRGVSGSGQDDANRRYVGHVPLVHVVTGPAVNYGASHIDDSAYIPAPMAGNPL